MIPRSVKTLILLVLLPAYAMPQTNLSGIINSYSPAIASTCANSIMVEDGSSFEEGDLVLIVQMKGADIDVTNSADFGNIVDYGSAGKYELNEVSEVSGDELFLLYRMENTYDFSGFVQVVRVPVYSDALVTDTLTCPAWDGSTGGILAFIVEGTLTLQAPVDVSGKGFRGGEEENYPDSCPIGLSWNGYRTSVTSGDGAPKGEGIAQVPDSQRGGRGKLATGGGGGNDHNAGGGGGSNGAGGGFGGERIESYFSCPGPGKGHPGIVPDHSNSENRIYAGSGGGSGHGNNGNASPGGHGGGIIFIKAGTLDGNGYTLEANGLTAADVNGDGAGGGGSGGSVLLDIDFFEDGLEILCQGGHGGNIYNNACTGPGGGGSGGIVRHTSASLPVGVLVDAPGGDAGTTLSVSSDCYGDSNGATDGENGLTQGDWPLLMADEIWSADFAAVSGDTAICIGDEVTLGADGGVGYLWSPTDGLSDPTIANPICSVSESTVYNVIVTDAMGCADTAEVSIEVVPGVTALAGPDTSFCGPGQVFAFAEGGSTYSWSPTDGVSDPNISDPVINVTESTDYIVTVGNGVCQATDTVSIEVLPLPTLVTNTDTIICAGSSLTLTVSGAIAYNWEPEAAVPCIDCSFMEVSPSSTTTYTVTGTNADNCSNSASFTVTVEICNSVSDADVNGLKVYPNPADHYLVVDGKNNSLLADRYEIYGLNGKLLQQGKIIALPATIPLQQLAGGNYVVRLYINNSPIGNSAFILQK
jgi:hypothetical protein